MSQFNQTRDFRLIEQSIHSVFLYAACTEAGFVKVGISGTPFERLYQIHCGSPSPVRAAQWVWIGSINIARDLERTIRREWAARNTRGEWYQFDYSKPQDKADFHDTLSAAVEAATGKPPAWERLGPAKMEEVMRAGASAWHGKPNRPESIDFRRR